jgi:hypothetical protein
MLTAVHSALENLIRSGGQVEPLDADVRFERPDDDWVASLTQPTVDFFLFDVRENVERRETNLQLQFKNGRAERRMPPRRIDLAYMVSVLTTEVADEHELLWRVLATLLKHQELPDDALPEPMRGLGGASGRLATPQDAFNLLDIWSAIGTRPRPALCYVLTAPLDLAFTFDSPLVLTRTARHYRVAGGHEPRVAVHIGGVVRDRDDRPLAGVEVTPVGSARTAVTDAEGRYRLHSLPEGRRRLRVGGGGIRPREIDITVPADHYDIVIDG